MAVVMAGISVIVSWPSEITGTRILELMRRNSSPNKTPGVGGAFMRMASKSTPISWRRICGAKEHAPGK